ncbi:MAG: bifunctional sugar-1-phosphate nucleotidylyltransferase/acetyltransferase [Candidatus Altiarchaeota archaeon]
MDAVILAAGEGTRLRPLTSTRPKPMIPIAGKPILEWDLIALKEAGFKNVFLIVGYKKDVIEAHFGDEFLGMSIKYVVQEEQEGTGHAVLLVKEFIKSDSFLVMNGDLIISAKTAIDFLKKHRNAKTETSMALTEIEDPSQYGIVVLDNHKVKEIIEKPETDEFGRNANAGIYVFSHQIFEELEKLKKSKRHEYEVTSAIEQLISESGVSGFQIADIWIDIGRPWDILHANEVLMKNLVSLKIDAKAEIEEFAVLKGEVGVGEGSVVRSGSYIQGPVLIGKNCVVGPNCFIRAYTVLMDDSNVGNAVEVKNTIIMPKTHVGHLSYVGDSIIGVSCNFGAGTKVANLKFDDSHVNVDVKGEIVSSGRRKMGVIMGDNVKTGINVSILPGRSIYPGAYVEAGSIVRNTIYKEPPEE